MFASSLFAGCRPRPSPPSGRGVRSSAVLALSLIFLSSLGAEPDRNVEGWSQDLLARLLTAPLPEQDKSSGPASNAEGVVLRSYQLRALHLGDPGRATHLVSILQRMLPPESRVTEDRPGNTLHIVTTGTAQQAALDLISAMDAEGGTPVPPNESAPIPEEVRKALESLASARPDAEQMMKVVADASHRTEERVSEVVRQSQEESRENVRHLLLVGGGSALALVLVGLGVFSIAIRGSQKKDLRKIAQRDSAAVALLPSQSMESMISASRDQQERTRDLQKLMESFSIAYQADRQRNTMIMESVAKKHGELASSLTQMELLRQEMGADAGKIFLEVNRHAIDRIVSEASQALQARAAEVGLIAESAGKRMEETANRLEVQNARAGVLAEELERTQKEVDGLFEKLKTAQEAAQRAQIEATEQRQIAYEKTIELTRKEAALAGLSLLMQEPVSEILNTLNGANTEPLPPPTAAATEPFPFRLAPLDPLPSESADSVVGDAPSAPAVTDLSEPCSPHPYTFRITPVA